MPDTVVSKAATVPALRSSATGYVDHTKGTQTNLKSYPALQEVSV